MTGEPSTQPTSAPTVDATAEPTAAPTDEPEASAEPAETVTVEPTAELTPEPSPIPVLSLKLEPSELTLYIGKTCALSALAEPADAAVPSLIWTSSDEAVAIVDADGVVVAVSPGTASIAATTTDENAPTAECAVTVPRPIASLAVEGQSRIQVEKSYPLTALDGKAAIGEGIIDWSSSDETVATVDGAGVVTGVSVGCAVVSATARDGSGLAFDFPVEVLRATVYLKTKSNKQFSVAVCENNEDAEKSIASMARTAKAGSAEFQLMRLVLKTNGTDPAIDDYNPDVIIENKDHRYLIQFTTVEETQAAYEALSKAKYVKYVEPDSLTTLSSTEYDYKSWGVEAMRADVASEYLSTTTSASIKVAVVDSGVSPHSFIGSKLIDGWDYVNNDNDPSDENGHGTHVAGTIVDMTQALNVSVVAYRAFDAAGNGYTSNITNAIMVAADDGCKVINLSARGVYSTDGYNQYFNAINYAVGKGATFCCAAGNDYSITSKYVPACITAPGCIVVASVNDAFNHSSFSNTGSSVDVSGPGESILSCYYQGGYYTLSGTSMATPHISAACAIIKLAHPGYSPSQVENALKNLCTDLGSPGYDTTYGYGIPDLSSFAYPTDVAVTAPQAQLAVGSDMQITATVSPSGTIATVTWTSSNESVMTVSTGGSVTAVAPGSARITATTVNNLAGYVDLTVPYDAATAVTVTAPQSTVAVGGGMQLTATVSPATANPVVTWSSSKTGVMTVSASGYVSAVAPGNARITAKTVNNLTGYVDLTVPYDTPTRVVVTAPQSTVAMGGGMQLSATVSPITADPAVTWTSSNVGVITVSASGYVSAVAPGNARITAKTVNNLTGYVDLAVPFDAATAVVVTAPQSSVAVGGGMQLSATVSPATANPVVTWSSSKTSVMTVSASGYVSAVAPGSVRITAKTANNLTDSVDLTVPYDAATGVMVTAPQPTLGVGAVMSLTATVSPATANQAVTWTSSDTDVVTVTTDGSVTAVGPGSAQVTATTVNDLTGYIDLTVSPDVPAGVTVDAPGSGLALGSNMTLTATVSPSTANQTVTWSSSNTNVLTVSASGSVTPIAVGTARVTAKSVNNLAGYVDLTVTYATATGVTVNAQSSSLTLGSNMTLTAAVSPSTANQTVTWSSSNTGVLTVTASGVVTPVAVGTARVTAKSVNNLTGYVDLTVTYATATGVTVNAPNSSLTLGSNMTLTATISPSTANQAVTWSSSNTNVLNVSAGGSVIPVAVGTARVTAKSINNLTGYVDLTVTYETATGVTVNCPRSSIILGSTMTLAAVVSPSTANQAITWSSSNENVLTVSASGSVTTISFGTARVTAKSVDGQIGYVDIAVVGATPTGIGISTPRAIVEIGENMHLAANLTPSNADPTVTWTSSNASVLTVSAGGLVHGVASGSARVTARTSNGLTAFVDLTVGARISDESIVIGKRQTWQLSVAGAAGGATWISANPSVATVSSTGIVKGRKVGSTEITATVDGLKLTCAVRVSKPVLSESKIKISALTKYKLTVSYTTKSVRWTSSRTSVATVNKHGKITARRPGTATITATVDGYRLKCVVKVKQNGRSYTVDMHASNYESGASVAVQRVYYSGSTICLDIYLVNNYKKEMIYRLNTLKVWIYDEETGTLLAKKKFKNVYVRLKHGRMKKITLRFYGSATKVRTCDLRLGTQTFTTKGSIMLR